MKSKFKASALGAIVLCLSACGSDTDAPKPVPIDKLTWSECTTPDNPTYPYFQGFKCSSITVPIDYSRPIGSDNQISLSLIKRPANNPKSSLGVLMINFGGPWGEDVLTLPRWARASEQRILDNFDLVSFDPRGTGANAVPCDTPNFTKILALNLDTDESVGSLVDLTTEDAQTCSKERAAISSQNIATSVTVQDVESIRQAIGADQINFVGYSYGTLLGSMYLSKYPRKVRAMVLDANMHPKNDYKNLLKTGAPAVDDIVAEFFNQCSKKDINSNCALSENPQAIYNQAMKNGTTPSSISITDVPASVFTPGSGFIRSMILGSIKITRPATSGDNHWFLSPSNQWPALANGIAEVATSHKADLFYSMMTGGEPDPSVPVASDTGDLGNAVRCADYGNHYTDKDDIIKSAAIARSSNPLLGGYFFAKSAVACIGWPASEKTQFKSIDLPNNQVPVLIVSSKQDSDAAPAWSSAMHDAIGNSQLLVWGGAGHTAYIGNEQPAHCVEDKVNDLLIGLKTPAAKISACNDVPNPFASSVTQ
jgi:pimeloyl-ACP methyl ester carboxylesterase